VARRPLEGQLMLLTRQLVQAAQRPVRVQAAGRPMARGVAVLQPELLQAARRPMALRVAVLQPELLRHWRPLPLMPPSRHQ
jgi:hypothetical protein